MADYSDEVLFAAGLDTTACRTRCRRRRSEQYRAIQEELQEAIKLRGLTLGDKAYVDLFGEAGRCQAELKVYGREERAVPPRCRTPIQTVKVSPRTSYFCPPVPELTGVTSGELAPALRIRSNARSPLPASVHGADPVADRRDRIAEPGGRRDGLHDAVVRRQSADREPFDVVLLEEALERGRLGLPAQRISRSAERAVPVAALVALVDDVARDARSGWNARPEPLTQCVGQIPPSSTKCGVDGGCQSCEYTT